MAIGYAVPPKVGVDVFRVNSLTLLPKTALLRGGAAIKVWWEAEGFPHALALWTVRTVTLAKESQVRTAPTAPQVSDQSTDAPRPHGPPAR